jgi:hypothetical protein
MPERVVMDGRRIKYTVGVHRTFYGPRLRATGGAFFLILLTGGMLLYLAIGLIKATVENGKFSFPNEEFWMEVYQSFVYMICLIACCGRSRGESHATANYDKM